LTPIDIIGVAAKHELNGKEISIILNDTELTEKLLLKVFELLGQDALKNF